MMDGAALAAAVVDPLDRVKALYEQSRFVAAYQAGAVLGPLQAWPDEGRLLAGRLASQLGLSRLGDALFYRAYRAHPDRPRETLYYALTLANRRGPLFALEVLEAQRDILSADAETRPDALALEAGLHAAFRDFERAHALIDEALALSADDPWLYTRRAGIHQAEDRYDAALADARQACALNPASPSALDCLAQILLLHAHDDEAVAVLETGLERCESVYLAFQLAAIEIERSRFDAALHALDRAAALAPLVDQSLARWFAMRRCDVLCGLGDRAGALREAERVTKSPLYERLARRIAAAPAEARRVLLPVGFIRQHYMTCAPATLTAISRFWAMPAEHLDIAEAICYDGTPHHSERRWAIEQGWLAREFTVDWNAAVALIDAGLPFTLTSVHPGGAHLQAVIGYDALRGTLLIRDPMERTYAEVDAEGFCAAQAPYGPRGMVLAPQRAAGALAEIALPDAALYDLHYRMQDALVHHRRDEAETVLATLEATAPDHRLAISARLSLARYDGDEEGLLAATDRLLEKFPDEPNLHLAKARSLGLLAPRERWLAYLRERADAHGAAPLVQLQLVRALIDDGREWAAAHRVLRRILGRLGPSGEAMHAFALLTWARGDRARALRDYRFAATVDETNEFYARTYFDAARALRRENEALALLHNRVARLSARSGQPVTTLVGCLEELERVGEARSVLHAALAERPEDGELMLFAADVSGRWAEPAESAALVERARGRCRETRRLRTAAVVAERHGKLDDAVAYWRTAVEAEPLDLEAQRALVRNLNARAGRTAAVEHLRGLVERFPHHHGVHTLYVTWLDQAPLAEQEEAVRRLVAINPAHAWARRELALLLARGKRFSEAFAELAVAARLVPDSVANFTVLGDVLMRRGDLPRAREAFKDAVRRAVDSDFALRGLMAACTNVGERAAAIRFIDEELVRQVTYGDGLLSLQALAQQTLEPEALLTRLREAHAARPDLWHAWVALTRQLCQMDRLDEAVALADETAARFPLLPRAHVERANTLRLRGDRAGERAALEEALRLSPGWSLATRALSENLEAEGQFERARDVLQRCLRHTTADPYLHGYVADVEWRLGRRDEALAALRAALEIEPDYPWAWTTLGEWAAEAGQSALAEQLAEQLVSKRPGEARCWLAQARVAADPATRMAAAERAIALEPYNVDARALKLDLLVAQGDLSGIKEALANTPWDEDVPAELHIREADCLARAGDLRGAAAVAEQTVAREPRFFAGWHRLAVWRRDFDDAEGFLAAAQTLHTLAPNDPIALGNLAAALKRKDAQADIRPQLRRALALRPDYAYAGFLLLDELIGSGEFDEATHVLEIVRRHHPGPYVTARELSLACRRGDRAGAADAWQALSRSTTRDPWLVDSAAAAYEAAGWHDEFDVALDRAVLADDANPVIGGRWVERRAKVKGKLTPPLLERVFANAATGHPAAQAYLRLLAAKRNARAVLKAINRHGAMFRTDPATLGEAAYALACIGEWAKLIQWFGNWRERHDVPAWALSNLVAAFDTRGDERAAEAVAQRALEAPRDHSTDGHRARVALGAALDGDAARAQALLAATAETNLIASEQFMLGVTQALIAAASQAGGDVVERYNEARKALSRVTLLVPDYAKNGLLKRAWNRAAWRVARMRSPSLIGGILRWIGMHSG